MSFHIVPMHAVRKYTQNKLLNAMLKYLEMPVHELKAIFKEGNIPSVEAIVIGAIIHAIKQGDVSRLDWFMEKLWGKERMRLDITSQGQQIGQGLSTIPTGNLEKILTLMKSDEESCESPI